MLIINAKFFNIALYVFQKFCIFKSRLRQAKIEKSFTKKSNIPAEKSVSVKIEILVVILQSGYPRYF
jgi:hypothetical protein